MSNTKGFLHLLSNYQGGVLESLKFLLPDTRTVCCKELEQESDSESDTEFRIGEADSEDSEPSVDGEDVDLPQEAETDEEYEHDIPNCEVEATVI